MTGLEQLALVGKLMTTEVPTDYSEILNRLDSKTEYVIGDAGSTNYFLPTTDVLPMTSPELPPDYLDEIQPSLESLWQQKIFKRLAFPRHWEEDGIEKPNMAAKTQCFSAIKELHIQYQLAPSSILASVEEGLCVKYDMATAWVDRSMVIEFYNDLDIALIVTDNERKEVVYREDVREMNFDHAVEAYQNNRG